MPTYFQRPENALKRANEFIDVGKKQRALDALYDVIKSKKHRTWQKIHEPIMEKYLGLCVDLRKSHTAKEGLYQYKNICQQVNINSLVDVVRRYIALAEEKTEEARQESHQTVVDVDDLEMPETPESMLLKAVSGEDTQDRTDRAILTPWVKFLWESYRQCLDLLRNNSRVERLYQDIAQQAFKFCLKYTRKTEFRKLCDNLRTHLGHIHKHQHQQTAINLNNPDSQNMHLETRLVQLDSAISMELWQEAFKAVEDIHGLIGLSKKPPKPSLMANYYQKLALVFWKSGNRLFHASTLHRLYQLSREQRKNLSSDELLKMASRVLCATIAVPIPPSRNAIDTILELDESAQDKKRRLSTLIMLQSPPKRQNLMKDLVKYNIMQYVVPELNNLYQWLEVEFHPLKLATRVAPSIEYIEKNEDLAQYVPALEDIIITRVLKQVSQVYQTINFSRLASLVPFASKFRLERVIVDSARTLELQVRIDHRAEALTFGTSLVVAQKEDLNEGPYLQSMPSEQIRNQLTAMTQALRVAVSCLQPKGTTATNVELKEHIISNYRMTSKKEHQRILQRRQIIEDRKEQLEHQTVQKEKEEYEQQEEVRRKAYEAELARLDREREERERQRQQEETEMIRKRHAKERLAELKKSELGARVFMNLGEEELEELDVDDIMAKQVEQLEKEKKELAERLKAQEKKIDYFARARRLEEVPLLQKEHEKNSVVAKEFWEQQEKERIETMKEERTIALSNRDRLSRMFTDKEEFLNQLKNARQSVYKDKLKDFEKRLGEERKRRLIDRKERRKEERRIKFYKEKEEEEQTRRDEEMKREREERERAEQEQREKEEAEYNEHVAKLEEQAAKQREREKEIEEREAKRLEELKNKDRAREPEPQRDEGSWRKGGDRDHGPPEREGPWRRGGEDSPAQAWKPSAREGGWRDREREREASWRSQDRSDDGPSRDGPPRDFRGDDRRDDFRRGGRDDFRRDDGRDFRRDDRDFRRDEGRDFRRDDRDGPGDWRRGGPPREEPDRFGGRDESRGWRDRGGPPRDEERSWRSGSSRDEPQGRWGDRGGERGPPRGPPRDDERDWRRGPTRDDDRVPPRSFPRDDQGPPRGFSRDEDRAPSRGFPRVDDRGPPRGFPRDDERGPPRRDFGRDENREDSWRDRGPPREESSFNRMPRDVRLDDPSPQGPPRGMPNDARLDDDRPPMRGMPRDARLDDDGPPMRGMPRDARLDDDGPPMRGMPRDARLDEPIRPSPREVPRDVRMEEPRDVRMEEPAQEGPWRRGGDGPPPSKGAWSKSEEPRGPPPARRPAEGEPVDDGWTTVQKR